MVHRKNITLIVVHSCIFLVFHFLFPSLLSYSQTSNIENDKNSNILFKDVPIPILRSCRYAAIHQYVQLQRFNEQQIIEGNTFNKLAQHCGIFAVPSLIDLLTSPDLNTRAKSSLAIIKILQDDYRAVYLIQPRLGYENTKTQTSVMYVLGNIKPVFGSKINPVLESVITQLQENLKHDSEKVRISSAYALGQIGLSVHTEIKALRSRSIQENGNKLLDELTRVRVLLFDIVLEGINKIVITNGTLVSSKKLKETKRYAIFLSLAEALEKIDSYTTVYKILGGHPYPFGSVMPTPGGSELAETTADHLSSRKPIICKIDFFRLFIPRCKS